jgi:hypothetical protein
MTVFLEVALFTCLSLEICHSESIIPNFNLDHKLNFDGIATLSLLMVEANQFFVFSHKTVFFFGDSLDQIGKMLRPHCLRNGRRQKRKRVLKHYHSP